MCPQRQLTESQSPPRLPFLPAQRGNIPGTCHQSIPRNARKRRRPLSAREICRQTPDRRDPAASQQMRCLAARRWAIRWETKSRGEGGGAPEGLQTEDRDLGRCWKPRRAVCPPPPAHLCWGLHTMSPGPRVGLASGILPAQPGCAEMKEQSTQGLPPGREPGSRGAGLGWLSLPRGPSTL